ncbi:zf-TFIIB domain-containing protein [Permianibacter sp. IMCC34836]|uniref:zf-TFIIB domain-containing protein n=1 Tax=Permianibacter fluminis TaxID=2738515 RepID=UPI001552C464|nr:zf-TFIIB domain-containing protein [Permianibacter fluminis]NQD36241.1 zf-TFIIB domain-containing protein [Permianibacter fluminis]
MQCPKCSAKMEKVFVKFGIVERCSKCAGLWFDALEDEDTAAFAEHIDTGNAKIGAEYNKIDKINCPVCPSSPLLRMVEPSQPHIWFEACPTCYGRFYDAGEFRDVSEFSFGDIVKRFTAKPRP